LILRETNPPYVRGLWSSFLQSSPVLLLSVVSMPAV